jgi:hypothetical protein
MAQITQIITIHEYNKMTDEQKAALSGDNQLAVVQQDWEEVRIQAAIAAMQGLISGNIYTSSTIRLAQERGQSGTEFIAQMATEFADDLIEELQKKGGDNGKSN